MRHFNKLLTVPKIVLYIIISVPAILVGLMGSLYLFQEHLIFHPEKLSEKFKYKFDIPYEEMHIEVEGATINALLFKADNSKGVVYYHHGNAGNLEGWGDKAVDFTTRGYDILLYDYRGYGKSTGKIKNEKMLYSDALAIYKKLLYDYKERDIILYGTSLGTGIASKLAQENHPRLLILETPYFNFYDVAKFHYPYLPTRLILHYQFKNNKVLPELEIPVYLIHGTSDETIPYDSSVRLAELSDNIQLFTIEDGSHNDLNTFHKYHEYLDQILTEE